MFDELIRAMKALSGQKLQVSLPTDAEGYLDRACPNPDCGTTFKVLLEDWERESNGEHAYCCRCGHEATGEHWLTPEQEAKIRAAVDRHLHQAISGAMQRDARSFNRRQRVGSFVTMKLEVTTGSLPPDIEVRARDLLEQKLTCTACGCRYAYVGAPFFCPICRHDDPARALRAAIDATKVSVARLPDFEQLIATESGKDVASDAVRIVLEDAMGRLVSAFEGYCRGVFRTLPEAATITVPRGAFQRLDDGSSLWVQVGRRGYADVLGPEAWDRVRILFQRRHLIAHGEGRVDQRYLDLSADTTYTLGQRIVVRPADVLELAELVERIAKSR